MSRTGSVALGLLMMVGLSGCGGDHAAAPSARWVTWSAEKQLLQRCRVEAVEQTHNNLVTLKLRGGTAVYAYEPRIDTVFRILNKLPDGCRPATVATE